MIFSEDFLQISMIQGVDQYIFLDNKGDIAAHEMQDPQRASKMVFSCGQNIRAVGKNNFQYAVFSRKNKKDIIIFPVGNYSLGVVKQKDTDSFVLVDQVNLRFMKSQSSAKTHSGLGVAPAFVSDANV